MPFRVILATGLILLAGMGFAQQSETDSLESLVKSLPTDTTKVWLLNKLVGSLREKDNNKALPFAYEAKTLAELLSYKRGLGQALENLGWILYRKGDYSRSLDISTSALKITEELKDKKAIGRCLINVAAIYYEQKQLTKGIETLKKAYQVGKEAGDARTMGRSLNNIAYMFQGFNEMDSAFIYAQQGILASEASGDLYLTAFAKRTLGDIYLAKKDVQQALKNFNECLAISVRESNTFLKVSTLHRIGMSYTTLGKYDKALDYLLEGITIATEYGYADALERTYKNVSDIYHKKNDQARAYVYLGKYLAIHDSLHNQRSSEQITLMQTRFDTELKQAQIELLTKDTALKEEEIERQRVWIYFYAGCLSLLIILAFVLFYNNRHTRQAKMVLEEKNVEIQRHTQELSNLNTTKDKLFSIISHDMRTPVASLRALMDVVGASGLSQEEFIQISKVLKRNIDSVYDDLDNLLLWAQSQLKGLQAFPETIEIGNLAHEKITLFKEQAQAKNITIINNIDPEAAVFADKNHVSLVFRNLIQNAIKFNRSGGTITLSSRVNGERYEIEVSDSGIGINPEDINKLFNAETHFTKPGTHKEKGVGIGLLLTKEFIETNHGAIWVTSEPGRGTTFTFSLGASKVPVLV